MNANGMAGLSRQQLRVIALLCTGATTAEIAAEIGIGTQVVHNYTHAVYRKAGLNTRAALIEWAKEHGLDDPSLVTPRKPFARNRKMRGFFKLRD